MSKTVLTTEIPGLKRWVTGKVRDVYELGDALLLVATDRISAFDVVMPNGIPDKGRVLTRLSAFWFGQLGEIARSHVLTTDLDAITTRLEMAGATVTPELVAELTGRSMLGVKTQALPLECVVRGYLAGSLWKEYVAAGGETRPVTLHGIALSAGLRECEELPDADFHARDESRIGTRHQYRDGGSLTDRWRGNGGATGPDQHRPLPGGLGAREAKRHHHCRHEV